MRLAFIDNIRWTMILLGLSMHAADTYSPLGSWYYTHRRGRVGLRHRARLRPLSDVPAGLLHGAAVLHRRLLRGTRLRSQGTGPFQSRPPAAAPRGRAALKARGWGRDT